MIYLVKNVGNIRSFSIIIRLIHCVHLNGKLLTIQAQLKRSSGKTELFLDWLRVLGRGLFLTKF